MQKLSVYRLKTSNRLRVTIGDVAKPLRTNAITRLKAFPKIIKIVGDTHVGVLIIPTINSPGNCYAVSYRGYCIDNVNKAVKLKDSFTKQTLIRILEGSNFDNHYKKKWLSVSNLLGLNPAHEIPFTPDFCLGNPSPIERGSLITNAYMDVVALLLRLLGDIPQTLYHDNVKVYKKIYKQILYRQDKISCLANLDFYLLAKVGKNKLVLANDYGLLVVNSNQVYHYKTHDDPFEHIRRTTSSVFQTRLYQWLFLAVNRKNVLDMLSSGNNLFPEEPIIHKKIDHYSKALKDENAVIIKKVLGDTGMATNKARLAFLRKLRDDNTFDTLLSSLYRNSFKLEILDSNSFLYKLLKEIDKDFINELSKFNCFVEKNKYRNKLLMVSEYDPSKETMYTYSILPSNYTESNYRNIMGVV